MCINWLIVSFQVSLIMKTKSDYTQAFFRGLLDVGKCAVVGHVSYAMAMSYSCLI